ncbi:PiggyBac transposable element-derived protein 4 [Eumeta japonica]|uniref:PiggyBac transposable element-derived protein 4 n=1 Tax=Eumeta variegata TaxID=151549 RepID=A0A4C1XBU3_EUMVA|nr:PiggyBac transposable element-derived protein 4 [Eumeta japonica]
MDKQLADKDIANLLFQELSEEDETVFDSDGEEFDVGEADSEVEENDADSTSSDSEMDVPLSSPATVPQKELIKLHYTPFENLTIDEELVALRGHCKFRQYLPSKPAKYGIKIFALVDATTYYSWNLEIYAD